MKALAGLVETLSTERLEKQIQQAITVAAPDSENAIRERDFTPTNVDWSFNGKLLEKFENIGNAANYTAFFEKELIPFINKNYSRLKLFRPGIEQHQVLKIEKGTRYIFSIGWIKK